MEKELNSFVDKKTGLVRDKYLKKIKCPLCFEKKEHKFLFIKNGLRFVRCRKCGFVFVNPRFKEEIILNGYKDKNLNKSNRVWKDVLLDKKQYDFNTKSYTFLLKKLRNIKLGEKEKILDIGCSIGHFMEVANNFGYITEGIELESEAREIALDKNFVVYDKKLEDINFPEKSFDNVALLGLIEHLPNPVDFMKEVNKILPKGGAVLFNGIPNINSMVSMILRDRARMFNGRNHLGYYNINTLKYLLDKTGFTLKYFNTYVSGVDSLINYFQFMEPFDKLDTNFINKKLLKKILKNEKILNNFLEEFDLGYKIRAIAIKKRNI